jgi:hypothetical protein
MMYYDPKKSHCLMKGPARGELKRKEWRRSESFEFSARVSLRELLFAALKDCTRIISGEIKSINFS